MRFPSRLPSPGTARPRHTPKSRSRQFDATSSASFVLLSALMLGACTRSVNPDIERGSAYEFRLGFPEIRASAIGLLAEDGTPRISVAADIVYSSLIYRTVQERTYASVVVEIRVQGAEEGSTFIRTVQNALDIESLNRDYVTTQDAFTFERDVEVDPGRYTVTISVLDQTSGKQTTLEEIAFIPDPDQPVMNLTTVRLLGRIPIAAGGHRFIPISTYDVPGRVDSLRLQLQVTNNRTDSPLELTSRLIRYQADTSAARPMQFNNYGASTIQFKGIDYDESRVLEESIRSFETPGSVTIEYPLSRLPRGNYRFEVRANREGMEEPIFKARDFAVKSDNYPTIQTARELAAPLVYLMDTKQYDELMAIEDEESLKQAIDRFWLTNVKSLTDARAVIAKYYQRVEEANKQFSNFKEGWKTDMGMMYILFGPPWYVERQLNVMIWSYAYDRTDPRYNFIFEQPKVKNEFFPFNNYLLRRDQNYYNVYYQQAQLWLTGQILTRDL